VCQDEGHPWSLPSRKAIPGIPCCLTLGTACSVHGVDLGKSPSLVGYNLLTFGTALANLIRDQDKRTALKPIYRPIRRLGV
jgi:hypothetical protein